MPSQSPSPDLPSPPLDAMPPIAAAIPPSSSPRTTTSHRHWPFPPSPPLPWFRHSRAHACHRRHYHEHHHSSSSPAPNQDPIITPMARHHLPPLRLTSPPSGLHHHNPWRLLVIAITYWPPIPPWLTTAGPAAQQCSIHHGCPISRCPELPTPSIATPSRPNLHRHARDATFQATTGKPNTSHISSPQYGHYSHSESPPITAPSSIKQPPPPRHHLCHHSSTCWLPSLASATQDVTTTTHPLAEPPFASSLSPAMHPPTMATASPFFPLPDAELPNAIAAMFSAH